MPFRGNLRPISGRIGGMIRMKRLADNLSVREAAKVTGIDYSTISRLECGKTIPNLRNFLRLVEWLGLSNEGAMAVARTLVRESTPTATEGDA